jgi:hypothetical protein
MTISIHDNVIYGHLTSPSEQGESLYHITLFTEFITYAQIHYADILFHNVFAHYFLGSILTTILFDVETQSFEENIQQNERLFSDTTDYGWPPFPQGITNIPAWLQQQGYTCFRITTSYGLVEGWIWAKGMEVRSRTARKIFDS